MVTNPPHTLNLYIGSFTHQPALIMSSILSTHLNELKMTAWKEACSHAPVVAQLLGSDGERQLLASAIQQVTDIGAASDENTEPNITCSLRAVRNKRQRWSLFVDTKVNGNGSPTRSEAVTLYNEKGVIFAISDGETPSMYSVKAGEEVNASDLRYVAFQGIERQYTFLHEDSEAARSRCDQFKGFVIDDIQKSLTSIIDESDDLESLRDSAITYFRQSLDSGFKAINRQFLQDTKIPSTSSKPPQAATSVRSGAGVIPLRDGGKALVAVYAISKPGNAEVRYASSAKSNSFLAYLPGDQVRKSLPIKSATTVTIPADRTTDVIAQIWSDDDSGLSSVPASEGEDGEQESQAQDDHGSAYVDPLTTMEFRFCKHFKTDGKHRLASGCDYQIHFASNEEQPDEMKATMSMSSIQAPTRADLTDRAKTGWDSIKLEYTAMNSSTRFWTKKGGRTAFDSHHDKGCGDALASLNRYLDRLSLDTNDLDGFELQIGHYHAPGRGGWNYEPGFTYKGWQMRRNGQIVASSLDDERHGVTPIPPATKRVPKK